jgi:hypothetical protein
MTSKKDPTMAAKDRNHIPSSRQTSAHPSKALGENPSEPGNFVKNPVWEPGDHGPQNADHELRKAYNAAIDVGTVFFWDRKIAGVNADEVISLYKQAFHAHRKGQKLAAERWARTAKHLARAFYHEAKIAYLEPRSAELPFLEGASARDLDLSYRKETTEDLLNSLAQDVPPGLSEMPQNMHRYLARGRKHLQALEDAEYLHELLRAERIKTAHEYGRVLECLALAYEAEAQTKSAA